MSVTRNILVLGLFWTLVIGVSLAWNNQVVNKDREALALVTARSHFQQLILTRKWNAAHGGVYVPVDATTSPNPYLKAPDRDIVDQSGRQLTKINPAFMTRQISEIVADAVGSSFHITSLRPLRPENSATTRERQALQSFEQGVKEVGEWLEEQGKPAFFYMAPLITEESCLKCHAEQGYHIGDVRGGISVTLPVSPSLPTTTLLYSHLLFWVLGLSCLFYIGKKLNLSYDLIKQQAVLDALTGIPNRRSFTETILREFNRSRRDQQPLSLIMCDIDNFKSYNDTYGHSAGDTCLKMVARGIQGSLKRPGDLCARYGGEEFVVILTGTQVRGALQVAERIRMHIETLAISHHAPGGGTIVTISLGVATMDTKEYRSYEELIRYADEALYQAKRLGKNRVQLYQGKRQDQE